MPPVDSNLHVLVLRDLAEARAALAHVRASGAGIDIMEKKAVFRAIRVRGLDIRAANILKQEMLSRGGEVATSREVYELHGGSADCLMLGTLTQYERLLPKLKQQPFGLRRLADAIETALRHYDERIPAGPPGLDLSDAPLLMGVLNLTADSFSDGGSYAGAAEAVQAALAMAEGGAALIDVGGESTRPGSDPLPEAEELARVLPVVQALAPSLPGRISVDTCKARVAAKVLEAGAYLINDISALRMDPEMAAVARDADCPVILMHMLGEPKTMQVAPTYADVVEDVYAFFAERLEWCVANGLKEENLLIDPGLGFGKTAEHNLALLRGLDAFRSLGRPIVVGASRKRFLGEILGIDRASERDEATAATTVAAVYSGAHVIRVHNVAVNRDAVRVARAILGRV